MEIPSIVERCRPIIYQGFESLYDYPIKINFTRFELGDSNDDMKVKPVLYYWVRGNIIGFGVYHWRDWSDCIFGEILPGGEHKHDFEGGLVREISEGEFESVTTFHGEMKYRREQYAPIWWIEAHGHGITPTGLHLPEYIRWGKDAKFQYISLDSWGEGEWLSTQAMLGRANLPDKWRIGDYNFYENPKEIFDAIKRR